MKIGHGTPLKGRPPQKKLTLMTKKGRARAAAYRSGKISKMLDKILAWVREVQQLTGIYTKQQEMRLHGKEFDKDKISLENLVLTPKASLLLILFH